MPRRPAGPRVESKYKYVDRFDCEEAGDHQVTPKTWPPPRVAQTLTDPSLNMTCDLCGSNLVVYEGHATGKMRGVTVILPSEPEGKPHRGPGRPRKEVVA